MVHTKLTHIELDYYKARCFQDVERALEVEQFPLFPGDVNDYESALANNG
jgi:hypothetical protein